MRVHYETAISQFFKFVFGDLSFRMLQVAKVIDLVEAVFLKQNRTFKKDEKILAYPVAYYINLFSFMENQTKE